MNKSQLVSLDFTSGSQSVYNTLSTSRYFFGFW